MPSTVDNAAINTTILGVNILSLEQEEEWDKTQGRAEWVILCNWSDRITLRQKLMGGVYSVGGVVTFSAPFTHPNFSAMYVNHVKIKGREGNTGRTIDPLDSTAKLPAYRYAELTIEFSYQDLDLGDEAVDFSFKMIAVPNNTFYWGGNINKPLLGIESPGLIDINIAFRRTKNFQASLPVSTILSLLGKVNSNAWLGANPEQALYTGASSTRQFTTQGTHMWSITHTAAITQRGWNTFINPDTSTFDKITFKNGNPVYPLADFGILQITS